MRTRIVVLATAALAGPLASPAFAIAPHDHAPLRDVDRRERATAPVDPDVREARRDLAADLGPAGEVRTDRKSGGVASVGRTDALLTPPSGDRAAEIVLDYVRATPAFGLDRTDMANLRLVARSVSPDGIAHLRFNQVLDGVLAFDSGVTGHVTSDGRLVGVTGAPVPGARLPDATPAVGPTAALGEARDATSGSGVAPAVAGTRGGPARETAFASGERATLRWAATAEGPRLTWNVLVDGADGERYDVLVDATTGDWVRRQGITHHLRQARVFPGDPDSHPRTGAGLPPTAVTMPPAWVDDDAGGTRLWGQFARTYTDPLDESPAAGSEIGGSRAQIPASGTSGGGPDWVYAQTFGAATFPGCPALAASGCTWTGATDAGGRASAVANERQAATNVHVLVSRFAEHLAAAPIGFDDASGGFRRTNSSGQGLGGDEVRAEVNDGGGFDNANFSTPPDGLAPRMQMYLFTDRGVNGSDVADIVYHEYAHGLSNRLVVHPGGSSALGALQSRMMGEAWSDYYALDLLVHEGGRADTADPGELTTGAYAVGPGGVRAKPTDCPVDPAGVVGCDGTQAAPVLGGYTYGDLAGTRNDSPHNGGEVWGQTLWDIRTALGRTVANALITGGMRLSVADPSMLDMRDAILRQAVATRSAPGAADDHSAALWSIFRARGMGADATTPSAESTTPTEGSAAPAGLRAGRPVITDPYPRGDNDGLVEPGEEFRVAQPVTGVGLVDLPGVTGTLSSPDPTVAVLDGTATWPLLGRSRVASNADPLIGRLPTGSCATPFPIAVDVTSTEGPANVATTVDPRPGSPRTVPLVPATSTDPADFGVTTATFVVPSGGAITDLDLRIDELRHTWLGDLVVELVHPDGTPVTVIDQLAAGNYGGDDILGLVLDDEAGTPLPTTPADTALTGTRRPAGSLSAFDGKPAAGTWTLRITDVFPADGGTLHRWGLDAPQVGCGRLEIPAATTGLASAATASGATVGGSVTPNGRATGLRFAYGTTTAYGVTTPVQSVGAGSVAQAASATLVGLTPSTTYHYRVEAVREGGQVAVAGADRTFTTAASPVPPPPAPPAPPAPVDPGPIAPIPTAPGAATPPPAAAPARDTTAPRLTDARATLARLGRRSSRRRATLRFTLDGPARVTVRVTRAAPGIRRGTRCVAVPRRRPRGARSCTRQVRVTQRTRTLARGGTGTVALGGEGLGRGRYTATLTAEDAAGNRSRAVIARFRVR